MNPDTDENLDSILNENNPDSSTLFDRVASIIGQARANTVRAINSNMVVSYWLIGREIVEEIQAGRERADYGSKTIKELSENLTRHYGKGFSVTNLKLFRKFYQEYSDRSIDYSRQNNSVNHSLSFSEKTGRTYDSDAFINDELVTHRVPNSKKYSLDALLDDSELNPGFNPQLSWSHYRALMRVNKKDARLFYEQETAECAWDRRTLERHIRSQYYERMLRSQQPEDLRKSGREITLSGSIGIDSLKDPYVLEFLDLPEIADLHENHLEATIITHLQSFLMELGRGFAFVGRQKRMRFDDTDLYVDLVFYNCILKCYLLIDLKMGELSYRDVGQMDGYVRMFDDLYIAEDDNPTIGLILCTDKNDAVARYSVLSERKQIFASKYMLYLPTEEELAAELRRERHLIEERLNDEKYRREGFAGDETEWY